VSAATGRRRGSRPAVIFLAACLVFLAAVMAAVALTGGGSKPLTAVQRCTAAYTAYVNDGLNGTPDARIRASGSASDVRILDAARKACSPLTAAQARQAAAGVDR
jgi:hypothetical protein